VVKCALRKLPFAIHSLSSFNPSFRIGQTRDVSVYRLIAQGTIDELKYLRQIYKLHLKQEIFRSAEGSDAAAPPRSFLGVSNDRKRKGELFGMENLMKFSEDSSFVGKVWKTKKTDTKSSLVAGNSEEIAHAWGSGGEAALEEETYAELKNELDELVAKVEDINETFAHHDLLQQGRVRTAYTQDRSVIMCGETQNAMEFIPEQGEDTKAEKSDHDEEDESEDTEDDCDSRSLGSGDHPGADLSRRAAAGAPRRRNDARSTEIGGNVEPTYAMNRREAENDDCPGEVSPPSKTQQPRGKDNIFTLCGLPVTQIRGKHTTFSKDDIFLPAGS
jgi:hypothetical protein